MFSGFLSSLGSWVSGLFSALGSWVSGLFSALGSWVVAASTGAIAAWVLSLIRERWTRPRLKVEIELRRSPVVKDQTTDGARTKYARLVVHNQGRTLAKNCCAYIDYIKRTDPTGSHYEFCSDLIDLKWSLLTVATTVFHVPSRGYRLLDVGHTYITAEDFLAKKLDNSKFWINGAIIPNRLVPELRMNATYEMHIRAYADNAAPAEYSCRIRVGTTFCDLTFEPCDDPRPRDQR